MKNFFRKNGKTILKVAAGAGMLALAFAVGRKWDESAAELTDEVLKSLLDK